MAKSVEAERDGEQGQEQEVSGAEDEDDDGDGYRDSCGYASHGVWNEIRPLADTEKAQARAAVEHRRRSIVRGLFSYAPVV
jgi:hypothetical protein